MHRGDPRYVAQQHVLDAGQRGRRDGDRISVATHALRDPQDVNLLYPTIGHRLSPHISHEHSSFPPCVPYRMTALKNFCALSPRVSGPPPPLPPTQTYKRFPFLLSSDPPSIF